MPKANGEYDMNPQRARAKAAAKAEARERPSFGKLDKAVVLYFPPSEIGQAKGACCAKCMMFEPDKGEETGWCTVVEGEINGPHGVCGLYVHGKHSGPNMKGMMSRKIAGYIDGSVSDGSGGAAGRAPTHCASCEYFDASEESCAKVAGRIEAEGCCNLWQPKEGT